MAGQCRGKVMPSALGPVEFWSGRAIRLREGGHQAAVPWGARIPGRDLHRFCWLEDAEIGELPLEWNYLAGIDSDTATPPNLLHYTLGLPTMPGYKRGPWADVWLRELAIIDATRGGLKT